MSPREKVHESNAEKQKSYRERLKAKLKQIIDDEPIEPEQFNEGKTSVISNGTAIFLPPRENAPSTKSTIGSTEEPLKSSKSTGRCELCGILMSPREGSRCGNCQQFQSKEEMLYARDLRRRLIRSSNSTVNRELDRIYEESMAKWRSEHK